MLPWQPNKMATGHKTTLLGRQSLNNHKCQLWFTSPTGYGDNTI